MRSEKIPFADTRSFSNFFLDYISQKEALKPFYSRFPIVSNFKAQLTEKSSFSAGHRKVLVATLQKQYKDVPATDVVKANINALSSPHTFTVTTGHQLNLLTGPLYFIYKIITVINTCRTLQQAYPDQHFVPVYWLASEDHDFAEISYFNLYKKSYTWTTNQKGAVGRFNPKELESLLQDVPGDIKLFQTAYLKSKTLSDAVRYYVNELFGASGLVVVDADDRILKQSFSKIVTDDLFNHSAVTLVEQCNSLLGSLGYKTQVNPRPINFFYLEDQLRARIEADESGLSVADSAIRFSKEQVAKMIQDEPEKFSPNVILRPLYQEMILPNLAYVGGPAEVAYWMQLKGVFAHYQVPFPILLPRNCALIMDAPSRNKFDKTGLQLKDLFEEKNIIFNHWVARNTDHNLTLGKSIRDVEAIFDHVRSQGEQIDVTLSHLVGANRKQVIDRLRKIEKKFLKAEKRRHTDRLRQIEAIKDSLFPGGGLQERTENFLNFYQRDPGFIQKLISNFDPFDFRFNVLSYDES